MFDINLLQEIIGNEISRFEFHRQPDELYAPIKYSMETGGKRIRPALVLASCNLFSEDVMQALPVALSFEIFHNFTLLHDDIMDNSPTRRNRETVHVKWNTATAILSGDAMMIQAYSLLTRLPDNKLKSIFELFNKTALEVCEGQQYDMIFEKQQQVTEEAYLQMIKLKTSVLIAACLKAGAMMGGAHKKDSDLLYDFGMYIGLAFQLQDDLLDTYADFEKFGKKIGNDILTGKKTFLLIKAFENANKKTGEQLVKLLNNKIISDERKISGVINIYNELNIKEITNQKIMYFYLKALESFKQIACNESKKNILLGFAEQIMNRRK
jgi:geranylgeranyl diphosphate synthase type II